MLVHNFIKIGSTNTEITETIREIAKQTSIFLVYFLNSSCKLISFFKNIYDINLNIKFPNDIYCNGKKIGGILTKTKVLNGLVKCVVIGIGINTNQIEFDDEIKDIATSVKREFGIEVDNLLIMKEILNFT